MAIRQYIGARYVPRFVGTYDATQIYDALDVVDNGSGTSYIARKTVPAGTPLTDTDHWFVYGASSGAIIALQNDMIQAQNDILGLQGDVSDLEDAVDIILGKNHRYVTIADSYGRTSDTGTSWQVELENLIGGDFFNYYAGSMGYHRAGDGGYIAETLLTAHSGDITDHNTITDIIFGIGLNDCVSGATTDVQLRTAISSLVSYCRSEYPNAKIWFGFPQASGSFTVNEEGTMVNYIQIIAEEASKLGCNFMSGLEYIMHDDTLRQADHIHPSADGSKEIAYGMYQILNGNAYRYRHEIISDCTMTGGVASKCYQLIDGPVASINFLQVAATGTFTFDSSNPLKIGEIANPLFRNSRIIQFASVFSSDVNCPEGMQIFNTYGDLFARWIKSGSHSVTVLQLNQCNLTGPTLMV